MQIADLTSLLKIKIQMGSVEVFIQRRMTTESYLRRALAAGVTRLGVQQNKKNNWSNILTACIRRWAGPSKCDRHIQGIGIFTT